MPASSIFDLGRLVRATRFSINGLRAAIKGQAAFRQELIATLLLAPTAFWLGATATRRALLLLSLLLILIVELINSAIETVVDRIGSEQHPLSGQAKDLGSAAVLLTLIAAAMVWGFMVWERFRG
jgi:diacylglycerol kinase (ATP)